MPFTFAHPAVILPLGKIRGNLFSMTGLVLGSMSPDFIYFIHFQPDSGYGHSLQGFLLLNLPLCFLLAFLFHYVIKNPLVLHMPESIGAWIGNAVYRHWDLKSISKVIIFAYSAFFGMVTHIAWDSFTHKDAIMVKAIPALSVNLLVFGHSIPIFKILQHGSTIAGILFILIYLYGKRTPVVNMQRIPGSKKVFFFLLTVAFSALLIFAVLYVKPGLRASINIGVFVIIGLDCVFVGLLFSSFVSRLWIHKHTTNL